METISRSLLTFLLNSLWQIPVAAAVAALACGLMRNGPASHRHAVWVAALAAAILLPFASVRTGERAAALQYDASLAESGIGTPRPGPSAPHQITAAPLPSAPARTVSFGAATITLLTGAYLLFLAVRLASLMRASLRTIQIRRAARAETATRALENVRIRGQEAFGLAGVEILFSGQISGPVAAARTIILPESLLTETSEDVLVTAIGHEMAHVARRDFGFNLLYELLLLPVSFHPAAWLIRRGIERTREMACDELVTRRLIDARAYAQSIMSIAGGMMAVPRPGYTLGVFDGDILEERIRRLVHPPAGSLKQARILLATGLSALLVCAVIASSLAFSARAQGAADSVMKQGEAAYQRGDYPEAVRQFQSAVRIEPSDLKAKISLAHALLAQYVPGSDPANPVLAAARQQLLDVLGRDSGNKLALLDMMSLCTLSKQFAEAHDWAVKAIQADSTSTGAYYTAGFVDWSMSYPDYAAARVAAGMQPPDPGIIPDASLRANLRAQHGAQLADGVQMLQAALGLDPNYVDAMAYLNLIYRIQAGITDSDAESAALIAKADGWVAQALAGKRRQAQNGQPAHKQDSMTLPPPPPPPPPPPGAMANAVRAGALLVEGSIQQAKLVSQTPPQYPPTARQAGVSGLVRLSVVIAKDGTVQHIEVMNGHPLLVPAAIESVRTWKYQPTLLNGQPVEVATTVNITFN